eukprot:s72_g3.t1
MHIRSDTCFDILKERRRRTELVGYTAQASEGSHSKFPSSRSKSLPPIMAPRALLALLATAAGAMKCPGSGSWIHASAEVEAIVDASCADVMEEMKARVQGPWVDPHNKGTYSLLSESKDELDIQRITGNKKFTDKITFTFSDFDAQGAKPSCGIHACSESQGFSIGDFSTNYCNIRNLYCGKTDGCAPVKHDFENTEQKVDPSFGAGKDKKACIVKPTEQFMV